MKKKTKIYSIIIVLVVIAAIFLIKISDKEQIFCEKENVAEVQICGDYIKVISSLAGAGSTFYKNNLEISCPVVAPDSMSDECKELMFEITCSENIC